MDWQSYKRKIIQTCKENGKSDKYVQQYIEYAQPLFDANLPIILNASHFSALVGLDHEYVCRMAYSPKHFYRTYSIKKKNGNMRRIDEPLPDLKYVQRWILDEILIKIPVNEVAKAYRYNYSVKDNARFHRKQKVVLSLDLKDFFPSIHIQDVIGIFRKVGYNKKVSCFLAYLCCYNYCLPQGSPTSPCISNIVMASVDDAIYVFARENSLRYTRYADDITISGDFAPGKVIAFVSDVLYKAGFLLNPSKTRVAKPNSRQIVSGIVVNDHMQLPKEQRRLIRQEMYYIEKYGVDSHLYYIGNTRRNYLPHLLGMVNYGLFINPNDNELKKYRTALRNMLSGKNEDF